MAEDIYELHNNDLSPEVREYATNLTDQLNAEIKLSGSVDFESYLQTLDLENTKRILAIVSQLNVIRETGRAPILTSEFMENYRQFLSNISDYIEHHPALTGNFEEYCRWIENETKKLPFIEPLAFKNDPKILDKLIKEPINKGPIEMAVALIFNRSMETLPEEERDQIFQEFDFTTSSNKHWNIGYRLNGGRIKILGNSGEFVGLQMKGGIIELDEAGAYLGHSMEGGVIRANKVDRQVGFHAVGGKIFIEDELHEDISAQRYGVEIYFKGKLIE